MKIAATSTPVVVLRPHHHGALGIFRSLGRLRAAVYAVTDREWAPPLRSRYCQGIFHWDVCHATAQDSVACLLKIAQGFDRRPILIPTDDLTTILVQEASQELRALYDFPILPPGLARRLCNKKELYYLCRERGIPTAETSFPQSRFDVLQFLENAIFPVMLKGIDGRRLVERTGVRMCVVRNADELLESYVRMEDPENPNLMLQEYIPGNADSVWMFNGYFNENSECLAGFTGRKLRQCPAYTGTTSLGICLKNEIVNRSIRKFLGSIGYRGIVDIGCRYDERDGQYKLLDVNPRVGCTFRLFVDDAGMDVVRACYLDMTRQSVQAGTAREGRKWLVENHDLMALPRYLEDRKITVGEWLRSLWGVQETAWFSWLDPSPFFAMSRGFLRSFGRWLFKRHKFHRSEITQPSSVSTNRQFNPEKHS